MPVEFEPFSPAWRADPYPVYRELRDHDPVHWAPESNCWCITRYDDVMHVLRHPELFSSRAMFTMIMNGGKTEPPPLNWAALRFLVLYTLRVRMNPFTFPSAKNLIAEDPPHHAPLRNLVNRGFTPRRVAAWEPRIRAIVDAQMERIRTSGSFDLMHELAIPLPVTIIAEMLGVEPERQADFKRWSDTMMAVATGARREDRFAPDVVDTIIALNRYLRKVVRRRRREPADDLVNAIVAEAPGGETLSDMDMVMFVQLLLIAGNETTTNLIGNAVNALLDQPAALEKVAGDPALLPGLVEETLRFDGPIQMVFRTTTREVEIRGTRIPEGVFVAPILGSANRDERRFEDPDLFDPTRDTRGHLGFGFGTHFCLGASLARLEGRVALEALVPELLRLERRSEERHLFDSFLVRGPSQLELRRAA